jgi:hypothetical protein
MSAQPERNPIAAVMKLKNASKAGSHAAHGCDSAEAARLLVEPPVSCDPAQRQRKRRSKFHPRRRSSSARSKGPIPERPLISMCRPGWHPQDIYLPRRLTPDPSNEYWR